MVRRALDGRKQLIVSAGRGVGRRAFGENAAHAVLLGVDKPNESAGQVYNVGEESQYSQSQIARFIGGLMGHEWELVEMPPSLSARVYRGGNAQAGPGTEMDISKIRADLGYRDVVGVPEALTRSTEWLMANRPEPPAARSSSNSATRSPTTRRTR